MHVYLVHHFLEAAARAAPAREALITHEPGDGSAGPGDRGEAPGSRHDYATLWAAACRMARALLELGVAPGDRVGLLAPNGLTYVAGYYGALAAGAVVVPINTAADPATLAHAIDDAEARVLIVGARLERLAIAAAPRLGGLRAIMLPAPAAAALAKVAPVGVAVVALPGLTGLAGDPAAAPVAVPRIDLDVASIIYTSGSTGRPRGATLSHRNLVANVRSIVDYLGLDDRDRVLAVLPFYYVYGQSVLTMTIAAAATVVVENRFQYPQVALDTLERERCTGLCGVPSTYAILLNRSNLAERELAELRWLTCAGGGLSPALTRRLIAAAPRARIHVMYGATEASARLAQLPPDELAGAIGSIGRAIPNVELTVRDPDGRLCADDEVGELVARGSNVMVGYWRDADETARVLGPHGYRTGDLARRDGRGLLWLEGRLKDMLKVGGHRVASREIEDALVEHPAVHEAAVIGVPDELLGDKLVAVVVLRGAPDADVGGVVDGATLGLFLKDRLPAFKIPERWDFRTELPKNEAGKVMKEILKRELGVG